MGPVEQAFWTGCILMSRMQLQCPTIGSANADRGLGLSG